MLSKKILTVALFLFSFSLFAREVEIIVEDIELGLPLEGAVIRSWDGTEYVCDEDGKALVRTPDDRQAVIQAAYPGYETGRLVVTATGASFTLGLRLLDIMENRELVIEATRPGTSETRTGRSVAVTTQEIARTAEIGIIEDVMSTIKLLPGVGYTGLFNAMPSIRGGDPNDMNAYLDGYYIDNPYHWGGGFSIFDPRMVQSAQLSHGVFSSRYGHTISGLLEIRAKKPSHTETEFELSASTSTVNFNLSLPLSGRGGIMFMGRLTYYDPVIWIAKEMSSLIPELAAVNYIRTAPYIRSGALTSNYRFSGDLELQFTGFWGMDGIGVLFENGPATNNGLTTRTDLDFDYTNYQGFITSALSWNPRGDMLLKGSLGTGYTQWNVDGKIYNSVQKSFSDNFKNEYPGLSILADAPYYFENKSTIGQKENRFNVQGRLDYDWDLGKGFLFAVGFEEMFSHFTVNGVQNILWEEWFANLDSAAKDDIKNSFPFPLPDSVLNNLRISYPVEYAPGADNKLFSTAAFTLLEYSSPGGLFGTELGLRMDHFYLIGDGFSLPSEPVFNPRFNLDFNVLKNKGVFSSLDIGVGTGLFSSMNSMVAMAEQSYNINEVKPNRSWTSIAGVKTELIGGINFNIEGYYKYVFDRAYIPVKMDFGGAQPNPQFNGEGRVWGIDLMIQKVQSRFWDGWISYSYNWAKYHNPDDNDTGMTMSGANRGDDWYFPSYHRFHNLNLVLNFRPIPRINIYTRFGLASGVQLSKRLGDKPQSYPVYAYNPNVPSNSYFIEKYYWLSVLDENNRTTPSLPMDIKFSFLSNREKGKTRYELYAAVENVLALVYGAEGNTSFNSYTGEENSGSMSARYDIPIPIPSFGFKISY